MKIVQLTPGAGPMFCGNCLRDNALVAELRKQGHDAVMVPLYLPLTLDEPDQSADTPIFFAGINVYLDQKSALFRRAPDWVRRLLTARRLLDWAGGKAAKTRAADVGELTLSMLKGELGNQARDLEELIHWLKGQSKPDVIFLSNALLVGMARRLRNEIGAPVVCMLQAEDVFLDALPDSYRAKCWEAVAERTAEVDLCIAPSHYFAGLMRKRLGLDSQKVRVVHNGINLDGYNAGATSQNSPSSSPVLGYFTRMCREKGLDVLIEAYIILRQRGKVPGLKLRVGGSCGPADELFVQILQERLRSAGLENEVEFCRNVTREAKVAFLQSLSVFSAPASYGEAFGLYLIEALAAGVPAVQPRSGAFPELIEATGGGVVYASGSAQALAEAIEELLVNPPRARALGEKGRDAVFRNFSAEAMAKGIVEQVEGLKGAT